MAPKKKTRKASKKLVTTSIMPWSYRSSQDRWLVFNTKTGKPIAVVTDELDAKLVVAAPTMYEFLANAVVADTDLGRVVGNIIDLRAITTRKAREEIGAWWGLDFFTSWESEAVPVRRWWALCQVWWRHQKPP